MEITVRVEVQYAAPEHATVRNVLQMFRTPAWVNFMVRYIGPHLKTAAPADKSFVENLPTMTTTNECSCVICMSELNQNEERAVQLPCGHCFHQQCIQSWLKLRSTCPTCRSQFRKAFSGSYAVRTLNSALVLKPEHRELAKDQILDTSIGKQAVRAIVNVTLGQIAPETKQTQYPCVLNALLMHANGDSLKDMDSAPSSRRRRRAEDGDEVAEKMLASSPVASRPKRMRVQC